MDRHCRRVLVISLAWAAVARAEAPFERAPVNACFGPNDEAAFYLPPPFVGPPAPPPFVGPPPPPPVEHGPRDVRKVALTFDACSDKEPNKFDEAVWKVLVETQTPATIFVGGRWSEDRADAFAQLTASPLVEIASHGYRHPHFPQESWDYTRRDLERAQRVLGEKLGRAPVYLRPPFGEYDDTLLSVAASLGLTVVQFDVASGDPDAAIDKDALVKWVLRRVKAGSIVVMHINMRGVQTGAALPEIVKGLRDKGFELVTVGELLRSPDAPALPMAGAGE